MDHFLYKNAVLHAEDVSIPEIAKAVGTPFYCYSSATLERHYTVFAEGFKGSKTLICFALKANSNLAVLKLLGNLGAGGDCVSEGEIRRCLAAGIPANRLVFSGVGKTAEEMRYALEVGIHQFNVESEAELETLSQVARSLKKKAPVAIRVNPDVDAGTHEKISTGRKHDKFGIAWENVEAIYAKAASLPGIEIKGISTHIGSQLTALEPFKAAFKRIASLVKKLRKAGHDITRLDLGGGLGIPYNVETPPSPVLYATMVLEAVQDLGCELIFEPGRLIAGNAGILVTQVIYRKTSDHKKFLIIDAAMNDLIRPALYNAYHEIIPVQESTKKGKAEVVDIVGPVCETGDILGKDRSLPVMESGALLAIRSAGAYGAVMSNSYNSRLLIPEVLVCGNKFAVIRPRETYEAMLARDVVPGWV